MTMDHLTAVHLHHLASCDGDAAQPEIVYVSDFQCHAIYRLNLTAGASRQGPAAPRDGVCLPVPGTSSGRLQL